MTISVARDIISIIIIIDDFMPVIVIIITTIMTINTNPI